MATSSEIALSEARATDGKTQQRTKQARARLPFAIATNLLLFVLPTLLLLYHSTTITTTKLRIVDKKCAN